MRLLCRNDLTSSQREEIARAAREAGFHVMSLGVRRFALFGPGDAAGLEDLPGVERIESLPDRPELTERGDREGTSVVRVGPATIGEGFTVAAGPCAVEDRKRLLDLAHAAKEAGADLLRGGAFKPRTSPYTFRGTGREGLEWLREASDATGLPVVTEALDPRDVPAVADLADMIQIGSRNMMNHALLAEAGRAGVPVLLKRGMSATLPELYFAAEYLLVEGAPGVVLCERGIRAPNNTLRNILDISAVPLVREQTHLPVFVDPSHATGRGALVPAMARAAAAAGASGVIVEIHDSPEEALSDGPQAIPPSSLGGLVRQLRAIAALVAEPGKSEEAK